MPTSSQAMILRSNDFETPRSSVSNRSLAPAVCHPIFDTISPPKACIKFTKSSPRGSQTRDSMEVVKFDVTLNEIPQTMAMNGFEGTFSFDPVKKAYKWQICSMGSPKVEGNAPQNSPTPEAGDSNPLLQEQSSFEQSPYDPIEPNPTPCTSKHTPSNENVSSLSDSSSESSIHEEIENQDEHKPQHRSLSPEIDDGLYRRLEELGFRRRSGYTTSGGLRRLKRGERSVVTIDEKPPPSVSPVRRKSPVKLPVSEIENIPHPAPISTGVSPYGIKTTPKKRQHVQKRRISLLDEIKDKVQWNKRILPSSHVQIDSTIRSFSACFTVPKDADFSHADIKKLIESQTGCKIRCLQFDPVTVRTSDPEAQDRWIVTFADKHDFIFAIQKGLSVNGSSVDVKSWDEVAAQERQSYKEFQNWFAATRTKIDPEKNRVIRQFLDTNWSEETTPA